jgi:fructose transport system permease protein
MASVSTAATADAEPVLFDGPASGLARIQHVLHVYPVLSPAAVLLVSCVVFTIFGHGNFFAAGNFGIILQQTVVVGCLAIGQTLIILTAGVDLSVGTAMLFTSIVAARLAIDNGVPGGVALVLGGVIGMILGALNGALVTVVKLPPFIVTLGTFYIFGAIGLIYGKARTISFDTDATKNSILNWSGKTISVGEFKITTGVVMVVALYAVFAFVLANTSWGRHLYAVGDDAEAARLAGIDSTRVKFSVYVVAGLVYGLAAWIQIGRSATASMNNAADANLETITAVVIGGTSLFGGRGLLWGSLIGAVIVNVFNNGLFLAGVNQDYRRLAIGMLILVAVALDQWIRKLRK